MVKKKNDNKNHSSGILGNKLYLYLTEFFAGMSVMAVELGASRLLAPYFSSSQIVWTIIIGTIMIAMALGNYFGGKSADKDPEPDKLYKRILLSAVWIAAIPFIGKIVILGISAVLVVTVSTNFLIWAAFLACMVIFVYPLFLLGTVTPSLVKYTTDSLEDNGRTVGTLGAFNTVGSIIGTFAPTFITIPTVGTAVTFLIFSGILLMLGLVYFFSCKRGYIRIAICTVLFIVFCITGTVLGFAFWERSLTYEGESVYNYLQVKEDDKQAALSTNVLFGIQSIYMKDGGLTGLYYDTAMAAPLMSEGDDITKKNMLILGMGTGTYAKQCKAYFPGIKVEGVEIDDKITDLAHKYFDLDDDIKVTTYDGRAFLNSLKGANRKSSDSAVKYDVIMVDAYQDITIPFQMSTVEFFTLVKNSLAPDGVMVVNMNMHSDKKGSINECLCDTIASVFSNVYTVKVDGTTNRELFASDLSGMPDRLYSASQKLEDNDLKALMEDIYMRMKRYEGGENILTDDKAPVELLGMQVIDDLISEELTYYKKRFKEDGIKGLID
ncbi:spermidine synthase [Ruminococcus albus]|uniref:Spermine synthase n=1 Tax=Ruminococcus albus (strain ATCC 27210 / DSM 20455 / JCM 14654 / NCDO 2250 / 7) TaxID=697329 RepID=E6UBF9_RUMA7|nr:fused MFS/spermidine synthase [Ruminococcus albus]ADU22579.1 Spermine synthase [Ruminococcus albus 7 = DSM 20455]